MGGAEIGLHNIALRLLDRGHKPFVIVPSSSYRELQRLGWSLPYTIVPLPQRIVWIHYHMPKIGFAILDRFFNKIRRRFKIDVWHVTIGYPLGVALVHYAERYGGIPYIIRCVGGDIQVDPAIEYGMRLDKKIDRVLSKWLPRAKRLIATTKTMSDEYLNMGIDISRVSFVTNGVDLTRFEGDVDCQAIRQYLGVGDNTTIFISVGRNHPKKNFLGLVDAADKLRASGYEDFAVLIVGEGVGCLKDYVTKHKLSKYVIFHEQLGLPENAKDVPQLPVDKLVEMYQCADIFVLPSLVESFGIVIVEAMAAKLPVITTDGPGCRDIIRNGRDGIMVPAGDSNALANAMINVLNNPDEKIRLSKIAYERATDFSWESVVDQYIELYIQEIQAVHACHN